MTSVAETTVERPASRRLRELLGENVDYLGADPAVGLVAATGTLRGVPVVCLSQDRTVAGGSFGEQEGTLAASAVRAAVRSQVPLVMLVESAGARVHDGSRALDSYGRVFRLLSRDARGVPRITLVVGPAAGGGAYAAALGDITVMTHSARMFLTGPRVVAEALSETVTAEALGGPAIHETNGVCDVYVEDERAGLLAVAKLVELLGRRRDSAPVAATADPAEAVPSAQRATYDVSAVVERLVDPESSVELGRKWARNVVTYVGRLTGRTIGIVANQPKHLGGVLTASAADKAARFVRLCSRQKLPLLVLVDTPGFMPGSREEAAGIIRRGASLVEAFAQSDSQRVTVILRKAFGGGYIAMNSVGLGDSPVLAWPDAHIGVLGAEQALGFVDRQAPVNGWCSGAAPSELAEQYTEQHLTAECAVRRGALDEIIVPARTRARVSALLFGPSQFGVD